MASWRPVEARPWGGGGGAGRAPRVHVFTCLASVASWRPLEARPSGLWGGMGRAPRVHVFMCSRVRVQAGPFAHFRPNSDGCHLGSLGAGTGTAATWVDVASARNLEGSC